MRIYILIGSLLMVFVSLSTKAMAADTPYPDTDTSFSLPASMNERIQIVTDRYIYGIGEKILFAGTNIIPPELEASCWSKVLYLELLTPGGTSVAQGKFPLSCNGASGYLTIPDQLLTGNYYLVAYTKWMRNFSPSHFHYQLIKIINPYTPKLETSNMATGNIQEREWEHKPLNEVIRCSTDRASYLQREKVNLTFSIPASLPSLTNTFSVTVVRNDFPDTLKNAKILPEHVQYHRPAGTLYLPETMGLSLSGRKIAGDSAGLVSSDQVNLAILGQEPGFRVIPSGPQGAFCFVLDSMSGRNDMYIVSNHEKEDLQILIDNDFANPAVRFPEIPFFLSESEKKLAAEIIFNMQINSHFQSQDTNFSQTEDEEDSEIISFYGLPTASILIDDFIDLPTLKEVLIELTPGVFPKERNNEPYLSFNGNKLTFSLINQYPPLLLVDHLPVFELEKLLLMSPKKINKVEVLNEIYILGNSTYGGIINIITRKGDLAGIDLPENSFFFDFTSFLPQEKLDFPRYEDQEFDSENPDYRNCLYWSPNIKAAPGQQLELNFFTSDNNGDYEILIRGIGKDGSILQGKCYFSVEE